ncbi:MAG: ATP-binding protein [Desulfurivibrionaceae bacterium]|nr:ATP-binding protein [Desulfurivibrionaceae bacterium]
MNTYQLILSHITAVLFCFSLYHLGKVFTVHKKLNNYTYFCIATFGGCLYVFLGLLLSFPLEDTRLLILHRTRIFVLMLGFTAWISILYDINFQSSRIPRLFLLITGLIALTVPTDFFLRAPTTLKTVSLYGIDFDYRFGTPGPIFSLYAGIVILFCGYTLFRLLTVETNGAHGLFSRLALLCTFLGGIHDYAVHQGVIHNIFIGEFLYTIFLITIFGVLLFDDQTQQQDLENMNRELANHRTSLEREVRERTHALAEANRQLQNEIAEKQRVGLALQKAHKQLENRVRQKTMELKKTYDQLLHAEKLSAIGKLSASIAHEFGSPIVAIRLFIVNMLMRGRLNKGEGEMAAMAIEECDRIKGLIKNLQDFNRPTTGKLGAVNIHEILDSMLMLCNKNFAQHNISIHRNYTPLLPEILGVPDQLKQVVLNLFNNATHAMGGAGGSLTITTLQVGDMAQVDIKDTGQGIKREHRDAIFQPFFSTKDEVEGTGLGLAVIYGIIKRHNGRIDVITREGRGTTMSIRLPLFHAEANNALAI